jgi:hypothetical protein
LAGEEERRLEALIDSLVALAERWQREGADAEWADQIASSVARSWAERHPAPDGPPPWAEA